VIVIRGVVGKTAVILDEKLRFKDCLSPSKGSIFKGEIRKSTVLVTVILKRRDLSTITNT
jgi:hypothetical protein